MYLLTGGTISLSTTVPENEQILDSNGAVNSVTDESPVAMTTLSEETGEAFESVKKEPITGEVVSEVESESSKDSTESDSDSEGDVPLMETGDTVQESSKPRTRRRRKRKLNEDDQNVPSKPRLYVTMHKTDEKMGQISSPKLSGITYVIVHVL